LVTAGNRARSKNEKSEERHAERSRSISRGVVILFGGFTAAREMLRLRMTFFVIQRNGIEVGKASAEKKL
jgi:hypothetical protein